MLPASFIQAYKSWVSDNEKEGQLPDLNLSVDQLFFIGFATVSYVHIEHYLETTIVATRFPGFFVPAKFVT